MRSCFLYFGIVLPKFSFNQPNNLRFVKGNHFLYISDSSFEVEILRLLTFDGCLPPPLILCLVSYISSGGYLPHLLLLILLILGAFNLYNFIFPLTVRLGYRLWHCILSCTASTCLLLWFIYIPRMYHPRRLRLHLMGIFLWFWNWFLYVLLRCSLCSLWLHIASRLRITLSNGHCNILIRWDNWIFNRFINFYNLNKEWILHLRGRRNIIRDDGLIFLGVISFYNNNFITSIIMSISFRILLIISTKANIRWHIVLLCIINIVFIRGPCNLSLCLRNISVLSI